MCEKMAEAFPDHYLETMSGGPWSFAMELRGAGETQDVLIAILIHRQQAVAQNARGRFVFLAKAHKERNFKKNKSSAALSRNIMNYAYTRRL
jgi:hypothetical protein